MHSIQRCLLLLRGSELNLACGSRSTWCGAGERAAVPTTPDRRRSGLCSTVPAAHGSKRLSIAPSRCNTRREEDMVNPIRRKLLKTGAAAAAMAATPKLLAQQGGSEGGGRFYEKGNVRIRY